MDNETLVKAKYPNAEATFGRPPNAKGWYIRQGPGIGFGLSRSASAAWRKVAEWIKRTQS